MKKRFLFKLALLPVVGLMGFVGIAHFLEEKRPRLDEEQFDGIEIGMTYDAVVTLLGCKPGDYSLSRLLPINTWGFTDERRRNPADYREWAADNSKEPYANENGPNRHSALGIGVWFDENGRVLDKHRMGYEYTPLTWFARLKNALRLETTKRR